MGLKPKISLILLVVLFFFSAAALTIQQYIISPGFQSIEYENAIKDTNRVLQAIERELHHINLLCFDWAAWDDTYNFIETKSDGYIEANLLPATFTGNRLNVVQYYDNDGILVWGKIYDLNSEEEIKIKELSKKASGQNNPFLKFDAQNDDLGKVYNSGILMTEKGLILIASRPIITSENTGPIKGTLLMGRLIDQNFINIIKNQTEVSFQIFPIESPKFTKKQQETLNIVTTNKNKLAINIIDKELLSVYRTLKDADGDPVALVKCDIQREITLRGKTVLDYTFYSIIGVAIVLMAIILVMLQFTVLNPIAILTEHSVHVRKTGDLSKRTNIKRKDELGKLSIAFDKMSQKLQNTNEKIQKIIDSMPFILVSIDDNGNISLINKTAKELTSNLIPDSKQKLWDIFPEFRQKKQTILSIIQQGTIEVIRKQPVNYGGTKLYFDITIYPIQLEGKDEAVILVQDVTNAHKVDEMLARSEKMLSLGGLASGMAHEINNPLSGIMQNVQLIKNRLKVDLPANLNAATNFDISMTAIERYMKQRDILKSLDHIHKSGTNAAKIVKNFLSFSKRDSSEKDFHKATDLIEKTIEISQSNLDLNKKYNLEKITIRKEYSDKELSVYCEDSKILQVLFNILKNAEEAFSLSDQQIAHPEIVLRLKKHKNMAQVEIEDNGPGIEDDIQKRIFEPFFSTKDVDIGTGLGLSLSHFIIVEDHGGQIDVESIHNKGTKFIIRLPLNP